MLKRAQPPVDFEPEVNSMKRRRFGSGSPFAERGAGESAMAASSPIPFALLSPSNAARTQRQQHNNVGGSKRVRYSPGSSCRTNEFIYTERDLETVRHAQAEQLSVLEKQLQGYKQEATTKVDSLANENASLRRALAELLSAKERLREDNKVFRSAVMKLDTKRAESARAQQDAEREAQRLREQVRLLEQQNLTLLMQLQQPSCRIDNNRWDHNSDVF